MTCTKIQNAFTVDVEDYFHVSGFADRISPNQWGDYESRVVANTRRILKLMERCETRGTFFILGWVADRYPDLVREIHRDGHEIGCHSYWHRLIYRMTPEEFHADLTQSIQSIANITGEPVTAFRAPSFSVIEQSLWALDIMVECGIRSDSSVFPVRHDRYGIPDAERFPHVLERPGGPLQEFPPSVYRLNKFNFPVAGGGYFRLLPYRVTQWGLSRVNRGEGQPCMFYIHPWEVDPDQPRLPGSWKSRFRHYQNLRTTEPKLEQLLRHFSWGRMDEVLAKSLGTQEPVQVAAADRMAASDSADSSELAVPQSDVDLVSPR